MKRLLLAFLLTAFGIQGGGFVKGTLIKTPTGYTPIENLVEGDQIIAFDLKNQCIEKPIVSVSFHKTNKLCELKIDGESIIVDHDHLFFMPQKGEWFAAENINESDFFLKNCYQLVPLDNMRHVTEETTVYDLTIEDLHNFSVSRQNITAHNIVPAIIIGISWFFGEGLVVTTTAAVGAVAATATVYAATKALEEGPKFGKYNPGCGQIGGHDAVTTTHPTTSYDPDSGLHIRNTHATSDNTDEDKGVKRKIANLPINKGDYPFIPKKTKDGSIPRNKDGDFIDKRGDGWRWDPIKNEWDKQLKNGRHINIDKDGKKTH